MPRARSGAMLSNAATDDGLRRITAKTGLFWPEVKLALEDDSWRESEAEDRQLMLSLGSWGRADNVHRRLCRLGPGPHLVTGPPS